MTSRLVSSLDRSVTYINALTALTPQTAKIPIWFDSDREAITRALHSIALGDIRRARIVRIQDTLSLGRLIVSSSLLDSLATRSDINVLGRPCEMRFDEAGDLLSMATEFSAVKEEE